MKTTVFLFALALVMWLVFLMSWRDYHAHGSQFIVCPAVGCSTTFKLVAGSGLLAVLTSLAFLGSLIGKK